MSVAVQNVRQMGLFTLFVVLLLMFVRTINIVNCHVHLLIVIDFAPLSLVDMSIFVPSVFILSNI